MAKYNSLGIRQCDQDGCKANATHWLVWTHPMVCCVQHMEKTLHIAQMMGHPTPQSTLRVLTAEEKVNTGTEPIDSDDTNGTLPLIRTVERDVEDYWGE